MRTLNDYIEEIHPDALKAASAGNIAAVQRMATEAKQRMMERWDWEEMLRRDREAYDLSEEAQEQLLSLGREHYLFALSLILDHRQALGIDVFEGTATESSGMSEEDENGILSGE